jgi:hypothetical protein
MKSTIRTIALMTTVILSASQIKSQVLYTPGGVVGSTTPGNNNVGIGTASPAFKLSVITNGLNDGIQVIQTGASSAALRLDNSSTGGRNWGLLSTSNGNTQGGGKLLFYDYSSGGGSRMVIDGTGKVGIGTTAPAEKFHLDNGAMRLTGASPHGGPMVLFGGTPGGTAPTGQWGIEYYTHSPANTALNGLNFWRPQNALDANGNAQTAQNYLLFLGNTNNIGIKTNKTSKADLTVKGKVLIGDPDNTILNTPGTYGLYVENGIITSNLRVAVVGGTYWPDYVFGDDYKLKSLNEISSYVKSHKHLPGIPSSGEVEKEGVDMMQMNIKLLEKVEELTLYLIKQEERIKTLEIQLQK